MSQKVTLSPIDSRDIEHMKPLLIDGKSQLDISLALNKRRETINRKISRWVQTEDFEVWIKTAWLDKYCTVDNDKAFDALTKLLSKMVTHKAEIKAEINSNITEVKVLIVDNSTNPIQPTSETDGNLQGQT